MPGDYHGRDLDFRIANIQDDTYPAADNLAPLADITLRRRPDYKRHPLLGINLRFVETLMPIAARHGHSVAELAIAWVLQHAEVTAAIVGARDPQQIEQTAPAAQWQLSGEEWQQIEQALAQRDRDMQALGPVDSGRV